MDNDDTLSAPDVAQRGGATEIAGSGINDAAVLRFMVRMVEELNSTLELDEVLRKVAEGVRPYVDYDAFGILLLDPLGRDLRFRFGRGLPREVMEHWRFGLGQGIVGTTAQTGHSIRLSDVRDDPRYINALDDARSELAIPLISKHSTVGVLDVQKREAGYFTEFHEELLTFLAGHIANAIENARLYENLRQQARSLSLMNEVGRELTSILELEALLSKVAELVKRIVPYQLFSVLLWNEERQLLEHAFSLQFDERFCQKTDFPLGYGICGTVAALRQPLRVPNVHLDPRYVRCGHEVEVRSEMVVPLVFKDRLIGVVDLESTEYNTFTEQHEEMLVTLASYVAIAIENAQLYERVRQDEQRLADDLSTAREIQKGLLPTVAPRVEGLDIGFASAPARQLGGDFYDFLPYRDGRLGIAVGDVAGKATAAALQGALAIGILREHVVAHACPPVEMLQHLNQHLLQPLANRFVALVYAVYHSDARTLEIANAGFTRPLLLRDGRVEEIPVQGVPLGLLEHSTYDQLQLQLHPGDVVAFCSDGLQEHLNSDGEEFGDRAIGEILRAHADAPAGDIVRQLLEATDRHGQGDSNHGDDRTVVVLKVD